MSLDEDLLKQLMTSFREELAERLAAINAGLLSLEQEPEEAQKNAIIEELFRHVHSLKGAARAVSLRPIEELSHGMEDVFGAAKRGTIQLSGSLFDLLYQGLDLIGAAMANLDAGVSGGLGQEDLASYLVRLAAAWRGQPIRAPEIAPSPAPATAPAAGAKPSAELPRQTVSLDTAAQAVSGETIRVPTARLDDLMAQAGELLVTRLRIAQQVEETQSLQLLIARWQREWQRVRGTVAQFFRESQEEGGSQVRSFLEHNEEHLQELSAWLNDYSRRVVDDANRLSLVTDQLQEGVKRARMLPLSTLLAPFRRMVRDLARAKGSEVVLEVHGGETEMDKHLLEQIKDPLVHLLRNCVDHGIELPAARKQNGKPLHGTITLSAERRGNVIVIEVNDDGAGIDTAAVREAAVRRGLVSADDAAGMNETEINVLIFTPGLSTAAIITEMSGRGIGLDVVRKNVEMLQGRVEVTSVRGKGTTFTLTVPFTLASTRCLVLRVAGRMYAVPLSAVERLVAVGAKDVASVEGREAIIYQGRPLSLVRLAGVLRLPDRGRPFTPGEKLPAMILIGGGSGGFQAEGTSNDGRRIAFLVDEFLGEQELVVKNLGRQLSRVPNVAGATILGTGQIVLILNAIDLVRSTQQVAGPAAEVVEKKSEPEVARKSILIVDDSITTRTLEKNILTTAGYDVRLATDGQEALSTLMDWTCDLIVADIDMPRLNGFQLTRQVKSEDRYRDIPVILVSSLDSPEDKAQGVAAGADAYIVKGAFDQDNLLETIRQLI